MLAAASACSPQQDAPGEAYSGAATVEALTQADLSSVSLDGELGCSFDVEGTGQVFVAMGYADDDRPANGLVRWGGRAYPVSSDDGGYDAMIDGGEFEGGEIEVEIDRTSDDALSGGESSGYPARISIEGPDDEEAWADGVWTCGP